MVYNLGGDGAATAGLIVALYLLAVLVIGMAASRGGLEEFHLAGRGLRQVLLVGTFSATIIGASSTLGMAGLGFGKGLPGAWWMLSGTIGLLILSALFAARVRATRYSTLPELVGSFYGERARAAASALIVFSWIGVIAVQMVASGSVLAAVFGGSAALYAAVCAAVFVLYTAHGGQSSVVRTDLVQLVIIAVGLIVLFARSLEAAGPASLLALPGFSFPTSAQMGGWEVASMVIVVGSAYLVGPDMYSRLLSAYGPKEASRAAAVSALLLVPMAFLITSLGMLARLLYPAAQAEQAIPLLMTGLLSPAFQGLVAAALLAAFMSSADTSLMTASSILTLDLYRRARPASTQEHLMKASRLAVLLLGALALALAIFSPGIIKTLMLAYTVFTGGLLVPVVAGFYRDRLGLTPNAALAALAGGGCMAILLGQRYPLLGMATSAALLFAVSWWERRRSYQKEATTGLV
jgi:SSS family solute:Na+ symporter